MTQAVIIRKDEAGCNAGVEAIVRDDLPEGDVTVEVAYSTINYKDALAVTGKAPVIRKFPMVAGIDFAGTVVESRTDAFAAGDAVLLNGWGVGETHWGGLAGLARVNGAWLLRRPDALGAREAMAIGTAGYTAMLCVQALENRGVGPKDGEVLVTGATGGVGGFAVALLAGRGYRVVASTGKADEADYLLGLGAAEILDRETLSAPGKPLAKERWAGVVDSVGGATLANACASTRYGGVVAACGMAQSLDFPGSVAPFILRGVTLAGIDSVYCPVDRRRRAWDALARDVKADMLASMTTEIGLGAVIDKARDLLEGRVRGRIVVDVNR